MRTSPVLHHFLKSSHCLQLLLLLLLLLVSRLTTTTASDSETAAFPTVERLSIESLDDGRASPLDATDIVVSCNHNAILVTFAYSGSHAEGNPDLSNWPIIDNTNPCKQENLASYSFDFYLEQGQGDCQAIFVQESELGRRYNATLYLDNRHSSGITTHEQLFSTSCLYTISFQATVITNAIVNTNPVTQLPVLVVNTAMPTDLSLKFYFMQLQVTQAVVGAKVDVRIGFDDKDSVFRAVYVERCGVVVDTIPSTFYLPVLTDGCPVEFAGSERLTLPVVLDPTIPNWVVTKLSVFKLNDASWISLVCDVMLCETSSDCQLKTEVECGAAGRMGELTQHDRAPPPPPRQEQQQRLSRESRLQRVRGAHLYLRESPPREGMDEDTASHLLPENGANCQYMQSLPAAILPAIFSAILILGR